MVSTLAVAVNGEFSIVIINTESQTQDGNVGNECAATAVQVFFSYCFQERETKRPSSGSCSPQKYELHARPN